ncbi:MAG TPA: TPM domain-containing protein [Massilibacterium sp.]|nr:TPM domain-containing protein [Massilibacterium sp.]
MRKHSLFLVMISFFIVIFFFSVAIPTGAAVAKEKQRIYDFANLLSESEVSKLERLSTQLSEKRETDFIILTTNDTEGKDVVKYMQDFYDEHGLGYDRPHGNTAILTLDMQHREVYLAGFYKAKTYLDDDRLDMIREKITPNLTDGNYLKAFEMFMKKSDEYMDFEPGVNPENILFKWWFQMITSLGLGGIIVGMMAYHSGGKVTVHEGTYRDNQNSKILKRKDQYIRTAISKQKKPSSSSGGGGGGGGITGGGRSHSGSRGSF